MKRSSVPTEIDANWNPARDDYTRGFLWTYQKYDWKGRVVRKINTDGIDQTALNDSDEIISYDGCGCAGGQVTTIEGENSQRHWAFPSHLRALTVVAVSGSDAPMASLKNLL